MEVHAKNCPGLAKKSEAKSHRHIPWDTCRALSGSIFLVESMRRVSGLISALTWAIDLPDGLICMMIGAINEKEARDGEVGSSWARPS